MPLLSQIFASELCTSWRTYNNGHVIHVVFTWRCVACRWTIGVSNVLEDNKWTVLVLIVSDDICILRNSPGNTSTTTPWTPFISHETAWKVLRHLKYLQKLFKNPRFLRLEILLFWRLITAGVPYLAKLSDFIVYTNFVLEVSWFSVFGLERGPIMWK